MKRSRTSRLVECLRDSLSRCVDTRSKFYKALVVSRLRPLARLVHAAVIRIELRCLRLAGMFPPSTVPDTELAKEVTIVIKTFERPNFAHRAIRSVRRLYPTIRIVVVDDSKSTLVTSEAEVFALPFDSGVSVGRSFAVEQVRTPFYLSLDDDFILYKRSRIQQSLELMKRYPQIDIIGGDLINLPFFRPSGPGGEVRPTHRESILPIGSRIDNLTVYDKVPQFFLARTERVRQVGWDKDIKRLDHSVFFSRAKGLLLTAFNPELATLHARSPFDRHYNQKRYDVAKDWDILRQRYAAT